MNRNQTEPALDASPLVRHDDGLTLHLRAPRLEVDLRPPPPLRVTTTDHRRLRRPPPRSENPPRTSGDENGNYGDAVE